MFEPINEMGVVARFCMDIGKSKWEIISIGASFPDATLKLDDDIWRVEFEYSARNFLNHAHDFRDCDLIICWKNDFPECPLPVIEIIDLDWININPKKGNPLVAQVEYWRRRAMTAEKRLGKAPIKIDSKQNLPEIKKRIIPIIQNNPAISNRGLAEKIGTTHPTIKKILFDMKLEKLIDIEGEGATRRLKPNGKAPQFPVA